MNSLNHEAYINFKKIKKLQDTEEIARHISGFCLNSNDYDLSLELCKYFANHSDPDIKANVIHGIGYIAMNFKKIDKKFAKDLLCQASKEKNLSIMGAVSDAEDDLHRYVKNF